MNKIGIIGAGNMGSAFYKGIAKVIPEKSLYLCDKNKEKLQEISNKNICTDVNVMLEQVDTVILAVKPQSFFDLINSLKTSLKDKFIISIMAGISIEKLQKMTGASKIVRAMPNLPIQVEKGVIGWTATKEITPTDKGFIHRIFSTLGNDIELKDESKIDAVTALSGSGPAYFFYLSEMISKKAQQLGFSREEARKIAERTFVGCATLLDQGNKTTREWRKAVTSKGGTTEAALKHLGKMKVDKHFYKAIDEAIKRSKELNQ